MTVLAGICYGWAAIGIGSRIAMGVMGSRWKEWETANAYSERRPAWVLWAAGFGIALVGFTWYEVITGDVRMGWIVAALLSLTVVKIAMFIFKYDEFRNFVKRTLSDRRKMSLLNVAVIVFSVGLVALGYFLYG